MSRRECLVTSLLIFAALLPSARGDDVRYYEQDGMTYRETRRVVQRPIAETRMQESPRTVYRQETVSETRDTVRTWWSPVTEYQVESRLVGRWNPFVEPYYENYVVPRVRWEQKNETVKVPVTSRRIVPETRNVQVPVTTYRMINEELITRVAIGPARPNLSAAPAAQPSTGVVAAPSSPANGGVQMSSAAATMGPQNMLSGSARPIGGIARLDKDPPRYGADSGWRASTTQ